MLPLLLLACTSSDPAEELTPPEPAADAAPDVLLVTIDTLRADRVGAYGDPLARTPALDGLAAEGLVFREAHSVTPLTLPSHASILSGQYPMGHRLRDNAGFRLSDEVLTLPEALKAEGYQTAAFVSAYVLDSAWGLDQGFDTYRDPFHPEDVAASGAFGEVELPSAEVVNAARAWWRSAEEGKPRFAWVHMYDPHTPWRERPDWEGDPYRGEVAYADQQLGKLLQEVGEDTLVVVTSDHGESLWTEGEREHGVLLNPHVTRVPLVIRPPGGLPAEAEAVEATGRVAQRADGTEAWPVRRPEGEDPDLVLDPVPDIITAARVVDEPVSSVDIAPTIASFAGASLSTLDGRDLSVVLGGEPLPPTPVYAETWFPWFHLGWSSLHMTQDGQHRVEQGSSPVLTVLVDGAGEPAGSLSAELLRLKGEETPQPGDIDAETALALQALGYMTDPVVVTGERPDPRERIDVLMALHRALAQAPEPRLRALEDLLVHNPDMADAHIERANTLAELGQVDAAWAAIEDVLQRWPDHPLALSNAAVLARTRGERDVALQLAERMQTLNPVDARGYRVEAAVRVDMEDVAGVLEATDAGLSVAPDDPNLHYLHALAQVQGGTPGEAVTHLQQARDNGSRATDIDLWLGVAHERAGQIDEAKAAYDAATRSMPGDARPWAMAGWMLYKADRCAEALPFLINVSRRGAAGDPQIREALGACRAKGAEGAQPAPQLPG